MRLTGTCRTDHAELPPARPLGDDLGEISASSHLVYGVNVYARPVLHEYDHAAELLDHPQDAARLGRLGRIHRRPARAIEAGAPRRRRRDVGPFGGFVGPTRRFAEGGYEVAQHGHHSLQSMHVEERGGLDGLECERIFLRGLGAQREREQRRIGEAPALPPRR